MDCLNNVIGITRSECDCLIDKLKVDGLADDWYKQSTSGLYLDELEGIADFINIDQSGQCEDDMSVFLQTVVANASKFLADDLLVNIGTKFRQIAPYSGKVGAMEAGSTIQTGNIWQGLKLQTVPMKGGQIKLKQINTSFDGIGNVLVHIYKVENGTYDEVGNATLDTINGVKANVLSTPIVLEMSEEGADFYILYQTTGNINARVNSLSCGCGSKEHQLKAYMNHTGVAGDSLEAMPYFTNYTKGLGLSLVVEIGCDASQIVCAMYNSDAASAAAMNYAIRYKAGELAHEFILKSNDINRYTMANREFLWGKRNHFRTEYNNRINWLAANAQIDMIDCYICNDNRVTKGGLFV